MKTYSTDLIHRCLPNCVGIKIGSQNSVGGIDYRRTCVVPTATML